MLSAQSRDENTALATKAWFKLARTPRGMLRLTDRQISQAIRPGGLYNNKTHDIRRFCQTLLADFVGVVPTGRDTMDILG